MSKPVVPGSIVRLKSQVEVEMTAAVVGEMKSESSGDMVMVARCLWYNTRGELQDNTFPVVALAVR